MLPFEVHLYIGVQSSEFTDSLGTNYDESTGVEVLNSCHCLNLADIERDIEMAQN